MGYQESFIYTNKSNVAANNKNIDRMIDFFKKYNVRCNGDPVVKCVCKIHFNERVHGFSKGMEMLVLSGERSAQRSPYAIFNIAPFALFEETYKGQKIDPEDMKMICKTKILFIEEAMDICKAEKNGKVSIEEFSLQPECQIEDLNSRIQAAKQQSEKGSEKQPHEHRPCRKDTYSL